MAKEALEETIKRRSHELGFAVCGITDAVFPITVSENLEAYIDRGFHGLMSWMETTRVRRGSPQAMWPEAKSAIMVGMNYGPDRDPMSNLACSDKATISVYARNRDYHDLIKGKLKTLAGWIAATTGEDVKVFVDTAPLMEKPLAENAGVGWQGKHTNLVSRDFGSWLFLGAILTAAKLEIDKPESDHCGSCSACLDVCPTRAFPAPYQLDARKCISYLTIEHSGPIPHEFRRAMGNRIYGCDDCLAICPWNKYAQVTAEAKLAARDDLASPDLRELSSLDDADFRKKFAGSPIKRIGRNRFIRNVLIAIGNSNGTLSTELATQHLNDADPVVRGAAVWAVSQLEKPEELAEIRETALTNEMDAYVRSEWE